MVLDIACGSGFGTHLIAQKKNTRVIGCDISEQTLAECKNNYSHLGLTFQYADGTTLPFQDEYFDALISFETIEHTPDYIKMLNEFNRVTKKNGLILLSTPNFTVNSPSGIIENPFHTQEFTFSQLNDILKSTFKEYKIAGQKYIRYENAKGLNKFGKLIEQFFYLKGIRKTSMVIQDSIMRFFTGNNQYPSSKDFKLVEDLKEITNCKTFFAICKK